MTTTLEFTVTETAYSEWLCENPKCRAVIGRVITHNKNQELDMVPERGIKIIGDADVHCLVCGSVREWHIGQEAIDHLINRVIQQRSKKY